MINGATRIVAIIGTPIAQVKSPENFNQYFNAHEENLVMIPIDLHADGLDAFTDTVRTWNNFDGFVITIPYKQAFATRVDTLTDRARVLGAVNVVNRLADGTLHGDMVDGLGCLAAARSHGFEAAGKRAYVIGTGGAGSAIAYALCEAGVADLYLSDLNRARLDTLRATLAELFPATRLHDEAPAPESVDFVMNATPLGMREGDPLPLPADFIARLLPSTHVGDVVTSPLVTPFLVAAREQGCSTQIGSEMARGQMELLGQGMGVMPTA